MTAAPLDGVTVVDAGHIVAGPYAGLVLADLGAEVIKLEHPDGGDRTRTGSRTFRSMFQTFNRDKQSIALDLRSGSDTESLYRLIETTDVFIENFAPGTPEKLGIDYETLRARNPGLVYASIKGFGAGPYAERLSNDPVAQAMSGLMHMTGPRDGDPVRVGASPIDMMAAANAVIGILGALLQREATGEGQHVVSPLFEAAVGLTGYWLTFRQLFDEEPKRSGAALYTQRRPYETYETAGGELVFIGCPTDRSWERLTAVLDLEVPERVARDRTGHADELNAAIEAVTREWDRAELVTTLTENGVQAAPVNGMAEVLADPHLAATGLLTEIDIEDGETGAAVTDARVPRFPIRSSAYEIEAGRAPPPDLGADTARILEDLGS